MGIFCLCFLSLFQIAFYNEKLEKKIWHVCSHKEQTSERIGIYIHGWPDHFLKQNLSFKVFYIFCLLIF